MYHYRIVGTPIYPDYGLRDCAVLTVLNWSPPFPLRTSGIVPHNRLSPFCLSAPRSDTRTVAIARSGSLRSGWRKP
jgi:hypothetical protein